MSRNKSKNTTPINDGNNSIISICSGTICTEVKNVTYASRIDGSIRFTKSDGLLFNLILNADILSIIPKVDLRVNKKELNPGSMYILDTTDIITCDGDEFFFKEASQEVRISSSEVSSSSLDIPPDITQEIKISSFSNKLNDEDKTSEFVVSSKEDKKEKKTKDKKKIKEKKIKEKKPKKKKEKKDKSAGKNTALFKIDKEKSSLDSDRKSANPLVRVLAILLDIAIAFIILEFIVIDPEIFEVLKIENYADLSKLEFAKGFIDKGLSVTLVFYSSRIIGSLIFGVSLGQIMLGMSEQSSLLGRRIKGPLRELLGVITGSLIILDLPCLIGKRTLKEYVTLSKVVSSGFLKTFLFGSLSFIAVFLVWLTLPILNSSSSLETVKVDEVILNSKKKESAVSYKKSDFFNIAVDSEQSILPFFYYKRSGKSIIGQPELKFYNGKIKSSIKFIKKVDYRKILNNAKTNNVLIKNSFPEVATILFDQKIRSFNRPSIKEVMKLTKESFQLNLETLIDHVLTRGPFVRPYLNYRLALENTINSNFTKISYSNIANYPYMVFHKTMNSQRIMGISLSEANIFDIQSRDKNFKKGLLASKAGERYEESMLNVIDILYQKQFTEKKLRKAFEISFEFLKLAYKEELSISRDEIINSFESQFNYLNLIKRTIQKEDEKIYIDKYVQNLSDLVRAYKDNDTRYFEESNGTLKNENEEITFESEQNSESLETINIEEGSKGMTVE